MSKAPSKKVPELRFPEFKGEWTEKRLGVISDVRDGTHESPKYQNDGFPLITSKNLMPNGRISFEDVSYISQNDYHSINKRSCVDIDDILFGMIGTIGNPVLVEQEGFAIKNVALIKELGELNNRYLIQLLWSPAIARQFHRENTGGTQKFIALNVIRKLGVNLPSKHEQKKIAAFLSAVDRRIEGLEKQRDLLKEYKKGLMQQLFSQTLRFMDDNGKPFPDWDKKQLGTVGRFPEPTGPAAS